MKITSVPIEVNPMTRDSRLIDSIFDYVIRSIKTIFRIFIIYSPLRFFQSLAQYFHLLAYLFVLGGLSYSTSLNTQEHICQAWCWQV